MRFLDALLGKKRVAGSREEVREPPYASAVNDFSDQIVGGIKQHGWFVVIVAAEGCRPSWAYSIGLYQTFEHPEIVVFGLRHAAAHGVINLLGERIRGGDKFETDGVYSEVSEGYKCMFKPVQRKWFDRYFGHGLQYYEEHRDGEVFSALQCILPDREHRFPWDAGFDESLLLAQPLLFHGEPREAYRGWPFTDVRNAVTITTNRVLEKGFPILVASHDHDGVWQFLDGGIPREENARVIALEEAYYLDPSSLSEIADLPGGWIAERKNVDSGWTRQKDE